MISSTWPAELVRALLQVEREMPEATNAEKADRLNDLQDIRRVTPGQVKNKIQALDGTKGDRPGVPGWRDKTVEGDGPTLLGKPVPPGEPAETSPSCGSARLDPVETQADMQDYELVGDTFVFAFEKKVITIDRARMDTICADYSEFGGGLKQAELARAHGLPLPIVRRVLTAYGQYKSSPPFTRETTAEAADAGELDALAERAVEVQEKALLKKIEHQQISNMRRRLLRLESEAYHREKLFEAAAEAAANVSVLPARNLVLNTGQPWHCHAPTTDEHAGLPSNPDENYGPGYGTPEAVGRIRFHADYTAAWVRSQPGSCETLRRSLLGDTMQAFNGTTKGGTPLRTDMSDPEVFERLLDALLYGIVTLRGSARHQHIYYVPGNHEGDIAHLLALTIKRVVEAQGLDDVTVHIHRRLYEHFRIGESLHMLDHGTGYSSLSGNKAKTTAEVNAREVAGDDFDGAKRIYTYVGHLHESQIAMVGHHHELIRLPAMCENNDYETKLRLPGRGAARLFRLNELGHITDEHRLDFRSRPETRLLEAA